MNRIPKDSLVLEYCKGKKVLDVGCVGQDKDYNNPEWLHNKIAKVSSFLYGVDINTEGLKVLKEMGFIVGNKTDLEHFEEKFDVIHMGDVIEHVDNAVEFLNYYSQFLNQGGKIIVTTPNSKRIDDFLNILFFGDIFINQEHTCWYCKYTFKELCNRAQLKVVRFEWLSSFTMYKKGMVDFLLMILKKFFCFLRKDFNANMFFVLELNKRK